MAITVKKGSVKTNSYDVSGDTLAEIWADIQKKGPKPGGAVRAGNTVFKIEMDSKSSKIECTTTGADGEFESEAKMTKGTLTYDCTIRVPKLKSDKKLSSAAKTEWTRYLKELVAHENEHVADFGKALTSIGKEIDALTAKGTGADERTAQQNAVDEYTTVFTADFSETAMNDRLQASADALDSSGHGPTLKHLSIK